MSDNDDLAVEEVFAPAAPAPTIGPLIASPFSFLFTDDDAIQISTWSSLLSATVLITGRRQDPDGVIKPFRFEHTPNNDRTGRRQTFRPGPGYLLNLSVFAFYSSPLVGHTYARVEVMRGLGSNAISVGTLVAGYVTANEALAWPGSILKTCMDYPGLDQIVLGTDPAPGNNSTEAVPTGAHWEVIGYAIELSTDANVANRRCALQYWTPTFLITSSIQLFDVTAGLALQTQLWSQAYHHDIGIFPSYFHVEAVKGFRLRAASEIRLVVVNIQVGDNLSIPRLRIREWLDTAQIF